MLRASGGIVDYVVGAKPNPGVFCLAEHTDPKQRHYLNLYKLGEGPLYCFYTPWHLCHFEVPNTVARVVLFDDADIPQAGPRVEVCACAKIDLKAGETLDEYGHYMTYGEAVNSSEMRRERYLPEGLVEGCKLKRDIAKDAVITYDDVELPPDRLADALRAEQYAHFPALV
jgi:predicted homoserine dehydrogenase-like protein